MDDIDFGDLPDPYEDLEPEQCEHCQATLVDGRCPNGDRNDGTDTDA